MGWGPGQFSKAQVVAIKFIPKGRSSKVSLVTPNRNDKSKKADPAAFVTTAARKLKLGDGVKIGYSTLSKQTWVTSITPLGSTSKTKSASGQSECDKFVFVGARKTRTSAGLRMTVLARKGSNMWTFSAPLEVVETASGSSHSQSDSASSSISSPRKTLSQLASGFTAGDVVALKYDTVNFRYVLKDIKPYMMSVDGRLTRIGQRTIKGVKYDAAYIRTAKVNLALIVPRVTRKGAKTDVGTLASTLKTLDQSQATFTYYKQRGVMWMGEATAK